MVMLELISEDFNCVRSMHVKYRLNTNPEEVISLKRSGYNFHVELPAGSHDIEVRFSVVGGRSIHKVDSTDPALPWIRNQDGKKEREHFFYRRNPPPHVQYFVCGPSWGAYISAMVEYQGSSCLLERHPSDTVPAVGGMEDVLPLPAHMLPPEVLLYVPTEADIRKEQNRMIFMNTPLEASEQKAIQEFYAELKLEGKELAHCSQIHILRLLQHTKGNIKKAIKQMECNHVARRKFLNLSADDNLAKLQHDLGKGVLYMHGRDEKLRPCLVIRASRIDKECFDDPPRLCRVAVFILETILRYGMVPGKVENWGVLIDLENAGEHGVPPLRLITSLVETLQNMYRFRMAWTKVVHAPWWFAAMWCGIKKVIPGESVKKVEILSGNGGEKLRSLFNPAQLEQRYGGSAPNLEAPGDFPYRFYPGPFSSSPEAAQAEEAAMRAAVAEAEAAQDPATRGSAFDLTKLHEVTGVETHEGRLWIVGDEDSWLPFVSGSIITKSSAEYLEKEFQCTVEPSETLTELLQHLATRNGEFRAISAPSIDDGLYEGPDRISHSEFPIDLSADASTATGSPVTGDDADDERENAATETETQPRVPREAGKQQLQLHLPLPVLLGHEHNHDPAHAPADPKDGGVKLEESKTPTYAVCSGSPWCFSFLGQPR